MTIAHEHTDLLAEIPRLVAARDHDRLADIYDAERAGQNRESILAAALEGLHAVEDANFAAAETGNRSRSTARAIPSRP